MRHLIKLNQVLTATGRPTGRRILATNACHGVCLATRAFRDLGPSRPPPEFGLAHLIFDPRLFPLLMFSNSSSSHRGHRDGGPGLGPSGYSGRGRGRGGAPPIDRTRVPRGICAFYWSNGACDRSFDCTFRHEARPGVQISSSPSPDYAPDFFSLEGLAINNGSVVDTQHNLRPSEAHNYLRPYLFDNFVFRNAINVEGFSRILASVNSRNRTWVRNNTATILNFSNYDVGF